MVFFLEVLVHQRQELEWFVLCTGYQVLYNLNCDKGTYSVVTLWTHQSSVGNNHDSPLVVVNNGRGLDREHAGELLPGVSRSPNVNAGGKPMGCLPPQPASRDPSVAPLKTTTRKRNDHFLSLLFSFLPLMIDIRYLIS